MTKVNTPFNASKVRQTKTINFIGLTLSAILFDTVFFLMVWLS